MQFPSYTLRILVCLLC